MMSEHSNDRTSIVRPSRAAALSDGLEGSEGARSSVVSRQRSATGLTPTRAILLGKIDKD